MGEWTRIPPSEPGWYWCRDTRNPECVPYCQKIYLLGRPPKYREWYTDRIQAPQENKDV